MLFGNTPTSGNKCILLRQHKSLIREISHKVDVIFCKCLFFFFRQAKKKNKKNNFASVDNKK